MERKLAHIEANAIIGVGLISLRKYIEAYITSKIT